MAPKIAPSNVQAVLLEVGFAVDKHGLSKTPLGDEMSYPQDLSILTEEVGEVAERVNALAFEKEPEEKILRDMYQELKQTAAVSLMIMQKIWETGAVDEEDE